MKFDDCKNTEKHTDFPPEMHVVKKTTLVGMIK